MSDEPSWRIVDLDCGAKGIWDSIGYRCQACFAIWGSIACQCSNDLRTQRVEAARKESGT